MKETARARGIEQSARFRNDIVEATQGDGGFVASRTGSLKHAAVGDLQQTSMTEYLSILRA